MSSAGGAAALLLVGALALAAGGHHHHSRPAPGATTATGNERLGMQMAAAAGWDASQRYCLDLLWTRESGWQARVWNYQGSGAYGIPQALPASKMAAAGPDWRTNPATQIRWGLAYIAARYGSPAGRGTTKQQPAGTDRKELPMERLRRACPQCKATGATWCTHNGPHGPQRPVPITPWWLWPAATANRLEDLEGPAMCEEKATSVVPNFMRGRFIRRPECDGSCHHRPPQLSMAERFDRATEKGLTFLKGVVAVAVLSVMCVIVHVLVIAILVTVIMALSGVAVALALKQRKRRQPQALPMPAPDPELAQVTRRTVSQVPVPEIRSAPSRELSRTRSR